MKQINDQYEQESLECELNHIKSKENEEDNHLFIQKMENYIAYNIVNNKKFYYQKNGYWRESSEHAKIFSEEETGVYLDKGRLIRKTKSGLMRVELKNTK